MSDGKTNTGVTMPDEVLDELDNEILLLKGKKKLPDKRIRSKVITEIIRDWLEMEDKGTWAEERGLAPTDEERGTGNRLTMTAD